jgi:hypothetical protein
LNYLIYDRPSTLREAKAMQFSTDPGYFNAWYKAFLFCKTK